MEQSKYFFTCVDCDSYIHKSAIYPYGIEISSLEEEQKRLDQLESFKGMLDRHYEYDYESCKKQKKIMQEKIKKIKDKLKYDWGMNDEEIKNIFGTETENNSQVGMK